MGFWSIPKILTAGTPENVNDLMTDLTDLRDNVLAGHIDANNLDATIKSELGVNGDGIVRRGKSIIATSESRTNAAYGLMPTPDCVQNVVMPTDGLIFISYQATWQQSVASAAFAAIFLNAVQLKRENVAAMVV